MLLLLVTAALHGTVAQDTFPSGDNKVYLDLDLTKIRNAWEPTSIFLYFEISAACRHVHHKLVQEISTIMQEMLLRSSLRPPLDVSPVVEAKPTLLHFSNKMTPCIHYSAKFPRTFWTPDLGYDVWRLASMLIIDHNTYHWPWLLIWFFI